MAVISLDFASVELPRRGGFPKPRAHHVNRRLPVTMIYEERRQGLPSILERLTSVLMADRKQ